MGWFLTGGAEFPIEIDLLEQDLTILFFNGLTRVMQIWRAAMRTERPKATALAGQRNRRLISSSKLNQANMQIGRFGFKDDKATVARARDEFARMECAVLPDFLAPDLAQRFALELDFEASAPAVHGLEDQREFGRDLSFSRQAAYFTRFIFCSTTPCFLW